MTNDKKFVGEGPIDAGDGGGDVKLTINEFDAGDGGFKINGGDFEDGIAGGVGERGGLKTDEKIDRKHNHKEGGGENFDEAFWPAERVEIMGVLDEESSRVGELIFGVCKTDSNNRVKTKKRFNLFCTFHLMLIIAQEVWSGGGKCCKNNRFGFRD